MTTTSLNRAPATAPAMKAEPVGEWGALMFLFLFPVLGFLAAIILAG